MADDFIDEMQTEAKLRFGKELSAGEVANEFAKHGFEARIQHLKNLKNADSYSVLEAARRHNFVSTLRKTHEKLRAIDR